MSVPGDYFVEITKDGARHYFRRRLDKLEVERISAAEWNTWVIGHPSARWATLSTTKPVQIRYFKANAATPFNPVRMGDHEVSEAEFFAGTGDNSKLMELLVSLYLQQLALGGLFALGQRFPLKPGMLEIGKDQYFAVNESSQQHCIAISNGVPLAWGRPDESFIACVSGDCKYYLQVHNIEVNKAETVKQREVLMERLRGSIPPLKKQWACQDTDGKGYKHYMLYHSDSNYEKFVYDLADEAAKIQRKNKLLELIERIHLQRVTIGINDLSEQDFVMRKGEVYLWNIVNARVHDLPDKPVGLETFRILTNQSDTMNYSESVAADIYAIYANIFKVYPPFFSNANGSTPTFS